jgi:hypothetical protein
VDGLFNQRPLGEKVRSLVPLAAQNKALWPFD